ncbi:hypothetical protein POM88_023911 [Heracleum sosnowskyi]|uniref:Pentatricopeptide repeat-containing protein n=1 Tax=Heracleum sosnowskyi TaxID=360622 RepID=A0AAD8MUV9_9APIA|nr:hypothetical protein POM88_023911 [Heracleum sosnowskyi]
MMMMKRAFTSCFSSNVGFDNLDDALVLFNKMLQMKPLPNVIDFTQLLAALVKTRDYSVALSLFRRMCALSIPVDVFTFSIVINCCCHLKQVDYGFCFVGSIFKRGFFPDVVTYTTLLRGLISEDKFLEAELLLKKLLKSKHIASDVVIFTTVSDGLCKIGNTSVAVRLFRYMEKKGYMPNTVTFNIIVDSLCKYRLVDDALDVHTYSILVDAHGRDGKIKDAEDLIEFMIRRGQYPNVVAYSSLTDGYFLRGEFDKALKVFETMRNEMVACGFSADVSTTSMLLDLLKSKGQDPALLALQKKFLS